MMTVLQQAIRSPTLKLLMVQVLSGFGSEEFSQQPLEALKIFTLTDKLSLYKGKHQFTFGTHNEFFDIVQPVHSVNLMALIAIIAWMTFMTGALPERCFRSYFVCLVMVLKTVLLLLHLQGTQLAGFTHRMSNFSTRFTATFGLRMTSRCSWMILLLQAAFTIQKVLWWQMVMTFRGQLRENLVAPQIPVLLHVLDSTMIWMETVLVVLRGGVGIFTSRIPFVWPGGMCTNNGVLIASVSASATDIANANNFAFVPDVNQPYDNAYFGKTAGSSQFLTCLLKISNTHKHCAPALQ